MSEKKEYVIYKGKKYQVHMGGISLRDKGVKDISEIIGLNTLKNLESLYLSHNQILEIEEIQKLTNLKIIHFSYNQISEIRGLETLINLESLYFGNNKISEIKGLETLKELRVLSLSHNNISDVKGLENLTKLDRLYLNGNPIPENILNQIGGLNDRGLANNLQKVIKYCRQNKGQEGLEKERLDIEKKEKESIEKIKKMMKVTDRLRLSMMRKALHIKEDIFLDKIFDWAEQFDFRIDGDYLVINKDTISDFIDALDKQFSTWEEDASKKL